ncbi:NAD(P)-dependent alcohol dehydrogenase [Nonomuraea glycinis]|uniref:NADPH:quinone reductase n=1 Tax=Nonomuraea glycinis TaxID=2047744 RepID=A0A918ACR0_9ACTN|nr:NAD(P)-dependent alcohol dehydrogenase [Nonomuraea glycinis]MCA2178276.1 NAD(P)-dependent alcohol dehydrogenase [Nonomuraea glycinis]GGP12595.1 NADPH:quinone reductase [Nonomuraea glycinis]
MKAFVLRSYGSPDVLELTDLDRPVPARDEVLVRVRATSVQPYDWHYMRGQPYVARLMGGGGPGLRGPKFGVLGADLAGQVEEVGEDVTEFRPGDEVYAMSKRDGFGEYACVKESELAPKPANLTFEQAAAVPLAANTALIALRDKGRIQPGQTVLVDGASGGVGTFAVQLAKAFGATVTGVCGSRNVDLVRSIGADEVVDYTKQDFTQLGQRYDIMLDIAGSHSALACRQVLTREGAYVLIGGKGGRWVQPVGHMMAAVVLSPFVSQTMTIADVVSCTENKQNLALLTELIEDGKVTPVIDRTYPFKEIPEAIRYQEEGHSSGKVVITY